MFDEFCDKVREFALEHKLSRPNKDQDWRDFWCLLTYDEELVGRYYVWCRPPRGSEPASVWRLNPMFVWRMKNPSGYAYGQPPAASIDGKVDLGSPSFLSCALVYLPESEIVGSSHLCVEEPAPPTIRYSEVLERYAVTVGNTTTYGPKVTEDSDSPVIVEKQHADQSSFGQSQDHSRGTDG